MKRQAFVFVAVLGMFAIAVVLGYVPTAAHDQVTVGAYELIVGWTTDPALVG